jgi:hypothetical protein
VCLTDQPKRVGGKPVVAELECAEGVALVSVPALGALGVRRRTRAVVLQTVTQLLRGAGQEAGRPWTVAGRASDGGPEASSEAGARHLLGGSRVGAIRLLGGMLRANRPWRLVPALSSAFAGALATGAFVLLNQSLWRLADRMSTARMSVIALLAVAAMVVWLIVDHHLWEWRSGPADRSLARLYNAATALTLTIGVLFLYLGLLVVSFVAESLLVEPSLIREVLGHPVGWRNVASICWLATSMATVGGAIGSGMESDEAAHEAAYGYRQRQRHTSERPTPDDEDSGAHPGRR